MVVKHDAARFVVVVLGIFCLALVTQPVLASIHDLSQPWNPPNLALEIFLSPLVIIIQLILLFYTGWKLVRGDEISDFTRLIFWVIVGSVIVTFFIKLLR